jgi:hypothetical protein
VEHHDTPVAPSALPHLRQDSGRPSHICTGTALAPPTSAPGLGSQPPTPKPHRYWAYLSRADIFAGTHAALAPATLRRDLARAAALKSLRAHVSMTEQVDPAARSFSAPFPAAAVQTFEVHGVRLMSHTKRS